MNQHEEKGKKRGKREVLIIGVSLCLFTILTILWHNYSNKNIPLANTVFIFINLNIILLLFLIFLVVRNLVKLFFERKWKGTHIRTKLVLAFVSLSLIPTLFLFLISVIFITTTIEDWFSFQVENSLKESYRVAHFYYQDTSSNAMHYAKEISKSLSKEGPPENFSVLENVIETKREEYNLGAIEIVFPSLEKRVSAINPHLPSGIRNEIPKEFFSEALNGKEVSKIHSTLRGDFIIGIAPLYSSNGNVIGSVAVSYFLPQNIISKMWKISLAYKDYKHQKALKQPIKSSYIITLLLVTILIIFSATWFGFYLAKGITVPMQKLAEGTQEIAHGNLDFHIDLEAKAKDEIGTLVESFNKMTSDIKASRLELEQRKRYMEIVLKNVAAGVISINGGGRITTINKSAQRILEIGTDQILNRDYQEVLPPECHELTEKLLKQLESSGKQSVEKQLALNLKDKTITILLSLSVLKDDDNKYMGMVLVFDDITDLVKVQRMAAWREVARRIAHEIKNPLTPIQLSAQRLRKRYLKKFAGDGAIFEECTKTIINQVEELKNLVNEFSNFARLPATYPSPNDLNELINEIFILFQEAHKGKINLTFQMDPGMPKLLLDKEQMKRVMLNLLDNAVAACNGKGEIEIKTFWDSIFQIARIEVTDNGCGISPEDKYKLFEPYFSTKKGGTGLGLTIVESIISDHNGYIRVADHRPKGTKFIIELPLSV